MNRRRGYGRSVALLLVVVATAPITAAGNRARVVEPTRSEVSFSVVKYGFERVHGRFNRFRADIAYDPAAPERTSVRWWVDVGSVDTGEPRRDRTLQSSEYFDAAAFPELSFESRRVRSLDAGRLEISGVITIRGKSRPLTIVARPIGGDRFESSFTLDRYDFDVVGGRVMGRVISRTVNVRLVAALRRQES